MILLAVSLSSMACEQYYLGSRPLRRDAATRHPHGGEDSTNASDETAASDEMDEAGGREEMAGTDETGSGGAQQAAGQKSHETGGGGGKGGGARNTGGYVAPADALRSAKYGDDSDFDQDADCKGLCEAIASLQCEKGLSPSVCTKLCLEPKAMTVSGADGESVQPFFQCAKDKVMMCNPSTGFPEPTNCQEEQPLYNQWYLGNEWLTTNYDAGFR